MGGHKNAQARAGAFKEAVDRIIVKTEWDPKDAVREDLAAVHCDGLAVRRSVGLSVGL
jgi:hypothetical protein